MIVLDTHVWFWWIKRSPELRPEHAEAIGSALSAGAGVGVSAFSCWEIGMLASKGRITPLPSVGAWTRGALALAGVRLLPLTPSIALASSNLPGGIHGDPADRIIVATARAHDARLPTVDAELLAYEHVRTGA